MSKIHFKTPENKKEFKEYDLFRWRILRKPIGKSVESLKDHHEKHAYHLIGILHNKIISCQKFRNFYSKQCKQNTRFGLLKEQIRLFPPK